MSNATKNIFNEWAQSGKAESMADGHFFSVNKMLESLPKKPFTFLDIGCGTGWVVNQVAEHEHCQSSVGIDFADNMIIKAKVNSGKELFYCVDFMQWKTQRQFDVIFSMESLYYLPDLEAALKKAYQMMHAGGVFLFGTDYYEENAFTQKWQTLLNVPMQYLSKGDWCALFEKCGFEKVTAEHITNPNGDEAWKRELGSLFIIAKKQHVLLKNRRDELFFREAKIDELEVLNALIKASKGFWGYTETFCQAFVDQWGLTAEYLCSAQAVVLVDGEHAIGVVGLSNDKNGPMLDYLFLSPEFIGVGLGRKMWEYALNLAKQNQWVSFQFCTNPEAESIYNHFGAIKIGEKESFPGRFVPIMQYSL